MQSIPGKTEEVTEVSTVSPAKVVKTTRQVNQPLETEHPQKAYQKKKVIFRAYQVIWYITGVIEVILVFRLILRLFGAYPSEFTNLIYFLSAPLAVPFRGIIKSSVSEGSVFEVSTVVAMLVYALLAFGLVELIKFIKPVSQEEVEKEVDSQ